MIESVSGLGDLRNLVSQEASVPALRVLLFMGGVLGAMAWLRRRPLAAWSLLAVTGLMGLGYWLIQIVMPFGFETDARLTREWAQAGVNALAEPGRGGFVWGTDAEDSLVSTLAGARIPFPLIVTVPQLATVLGFALFALAPFALLKNRTTAAFAASLILGGGVWPGLSPYPSILLRPAALVLPGLLFGFALILARLSRLPPRFKRARLGLIGGAIAIGASARALGASAGLEGVADLLMSGAVIMLASPLRAVLRARLSAAKARRVEAALLLMAFGGSGLLWWDPPRSVAGFESARNGSAALLRPMSWIRENVAPGGVILASAVYSAPIATFGGRRVLFAPAASESATAPLPEPFRRARLAESTRLGQPSLRLAEAFSVTHLFLGPGEENPGAGSGGVVPGEPTMRLLLVYQDAEDFRVFQLVKK